MAARYETGDLVKVTYYFYLGHRYTDQEGTIIEKSIWGDYKVDIYNKECESIHVCYIKASNIRIIKRATPPVKKSQFLENLL